MAIIVERDIRCIRADSKQELIDYKIAFEI
jgi:hypothetical protein